MGKDLAKVQSSQHSLPKAVMEASKVWYDAMPVKVRQRRRYPDPQQSTTYLFDCVAVHLAFSQEYFEMKQLPICITPDGMTKVVEAAAADALVDVAVECVDVDGFTDLVVSRVTSDSTGTVRSLPDTRKARL